MIDPIPLPAGAEIRSVLDPGAATEAVESVVGFEVAGRYREGAVVVVVPVREMLVPDLVESAGAAPGSVETAGAANPVEPGVPVAPCVDKSSATSS